MDFTGVVVVTGGASGIGSALAQRFAALGSRVVVADLSGAAAAAADLPGSGHLGLDLDVTSAEAVAAAVARIEAEVGPIAMYCSNAGIATAPGLGSDGDWARSFGVHVMAHVYAARAVLPLMVARGAGHFMITASAAGLLAEMDVAAYSVTKHGSVALAEWLAIRYGDAGVTFSCLCPQGVNTPLLANAPADSSTLAAGALLEPGDVADAVIDALNAGRFLILPHPEVATYMRHRAEDPDRWLAGMRRVWRRLHPGRPA